MHPEIADFALAAALLGLGALVATAARLPAQPLYLLVGIVVGGRLDVTQLQPLPDLGLLLLIFSVGLEFGPERLVGEPPRQCDKERPLAVRQLPD